MAHPYSSQRFKPVVDLFNRQRKLSVPGCVHHQHLIKLHSGFKPPGRVRGAGLLLWFIRGELGRPSPRTLPGGLKSRMQLDLEYLAASCRIRWASVRVAVSAPSALDVSLVVSGQRESTKRYLILTRAVPIWIAGSWRLTLGNWTC